MKRHSSNWKQVERIVASKIGGQRIPLSGRNNMGKIGDVEISGYHVEVKSGRQVPKAVTKWLDTIRALSQLRVIPVLVMKPFGKQEEIAVLSMTDFAKLAEAARGRTMNMDD